MEVDYQTSFLGSILAPQMKISSNVEARLQLAGPYIERIAGTYSLVRRGIITDSEGFELRSMLKIMWYVGVVHG